MLLILFLNITFTQSSQTLNKTIQLLFFTDTVDIEYQQLENITEKIVPEKKIQLKGLIKNKGIPCFLRLKIEPKDLLISMNHEWFLSIDGYYYYEKELLENETIEVTPQLYFKNDFFVMHKESFDYEIKVEAIQSKNFELLRKNDYSWEDIEIEQCMYYRFGGQYE